MHVTFSTLQPTEDGYYLVRFNKTGGIHLIILQTELDGRRSILPDVCQFKHSHDKKALKCKESATLYFHEFPNSEWSERISVI